MIRLFTANVDDEKGVANVLDTGLEESKKKTIYFMSNGKWVQIVHRDYKEELKADGFWVAGIFENGNRVEV